MVLFFRGVHSMNTMRKWVVNYCMIVIYMKYHHENQISQEV